jgi:multiple sugar transport system ATP-binding protein
VVGCCGHGRKLGDRGFHCDCSTGADGALALRLADGTLLPLSAGAVPRWHNVNGRRVTLGIRPEHMAGGQIGPATVTLVPQAIEPLGPHTLLIGQLEGAPLTAQVDAHFSAEPEVPCRITCDMTKAHLFDAATGRVL